MSQFNARSLRLYGGNPSGDVQVQQAASPTNQLVTEALASGTYGRAVGGPLKTGDFTVQVFVDSAGGAGDKATIWYSDLPNPDPTVDGHWWQDTATAASFDLTATGPAAYVGRVLAEWIRVKVVTTGASLRVFARVTGQADDRG